MTAPATIAQTIAANLRADVIVAQGAPVALARVFDEKRKTYHWESGGPIAIVQLGENGIDEVRHTVGTKKRITYHARVTVIWPRAEKLDPTTDNVIEGEDFLALLESVKVSLRKHSSLGGLVLRCAEGDIRIPRVDYQPGNIPHRLADLDFDVLDEINAQAQG